jgi:predicted metal-dependent enzyme (double-stranded beta helix superfamily)
MKNRDWLLTGDGQCLSCPSPREWDLLRTEYRFHRFLTEVEDVVNAAEERRETEEEFLPALRRLVRQLAMNCYWVRTRVPEPCPETGMSLLMLYDELGFPLTVQTETILPGAGSPIHNHGTWGVVVVLEGQQKNTFWKRSPSGEFPDKIERVGDRVLEAGDMISFTTEAIHSVEAVGSQPAITFNLYGETVSSKRFLFDAVRHTAKHF